MNRREVLRMLLAGAAGSLILPRKTFFLPPVGGWPGDNVRWLEREFQQALYDTLERGPRMPYTDSGIRQIEIAVHQAVDQVLYRHRSELDTQFGRGVINVALACPPFPLSGVIAITTKVST